MYFPAGRYLTGSLQLKSNVTLYLEKEAVLLGSTSPYDYPGFSTEKELKVNNDHFDQALIYAEEAENIGITGEGCIDGQGRELVLTIDSLHHTGELVDKHYNTYRKRPNTRPKLLFMRNCRKVELRKTDFRSGAAWGLSFSLCTDLTIDSLHVENRAYWNNDGIDISDCKDVRISNCFINSADDGICLKSHNRGAWNDRVSISNCHIISSASAIKFGTESLGGFKNVTIDNIRIKDTPRFVTGADIKAVLNSGDSLRMDVAEGMPLTLSILSVTGGSSVEMNMDPAKIAVTVPVTSITGVTKDLKEGSRVNIYTTGGDANGTTLLFQNMRVLSVEKDSNGELSSATIEVSTDESLKLVYAANTSSIYFGLVDSSGYEYTEEKTPSYAPATTQENQ